MKTYAQACEAGDIHKHLPTLKKYAEDCNSVLEIGLGFGSSTLAFMEGNAKYIRTIEIDPNWNHNMITDLRTTAKIKGIDYDLIYTDSRNYTPDREYDMLFIDGDHSHLTVKKELEIYPKFAKKYIGFHDVVTFGYRDMNITPGQEEHGINWPIERFLANNPEWKIDYISLFNNGLLILKRA